MRTVRTIVEFRDLKEDILRKPGDIFQVEDKRADYLKQLGFVALEEEKPKKKTAKK